MKKLLLFLVVLMMILSGLTVNTQSFQVTTKTVTSIGTDTSIMVIITAQQFSLETHPLVEHKTHHGINTSIKTIEDIYQEYPGRDHAEQIKYFIKYLKDTYQTIFVLLLGGTEIIPTRYTHIYYKGDFGYPTPSQWVFPSDFYYADIYDTNGTFSSWDSNNNSVFAEYAWEGNYDAVDFKPDVYVGRLACNNENEVDICVQKIINYETSQAWSQEWFTTLVCVGGDSLPGDADNIDEGEYVQQHVIDILEGFIPKRIWASNGNLRTSSAINEAINNGAGFVFFNGHGLNDIWATHPHNSNVWIPPGYYTLDDINALDNDDKLPIVISDACYHGQYDVFDDCFAWSFVRNPHGGAIAFIGGSDTDLAYSGEAIIQKGIERLCLEISYQYMDHCPFLGFLIGNAISNYTDADMNEIDMITVLQNHLFGDPSLRISGCSQPPVTPDRPTGTSSGEINVNYSYSVKTVDPDDDQLYYMWDWGDGTPFVWTGPYDSGENATATHIWTVKGTYSVKVRAKDATNSISGWSDPLPITMPYSYNSFHQFFEWLFQRFTSAFPILKQRLGY